MSSISCDTLEIELHLKQQRDVVAFERNKRDEDKRLRVLLHPFHDSRTDAGTKVSGVKLRGYRRM